MLSVIVPIYHFLETNFDDILNCYVNQTLNRSLWEVIFLLTNPDSSDIMADKLKKTARFWRVNFKTIILKGTNNCTARNYGVEKSQGTIIVFIDGDQVFSNNLFKEYYQNITNGYAGIGISNIELYFKEKTLFIKQQNPLNNCKNRQDYNFGDILPSVMINKLTLTEALGLSFRHNPNNLCDYINFITRNCGLWKKDFLRVGGFNDEMGYTPISKSRGWEDVELGIRLFENKIKFIFIPCWTGHIEHPHLSRDNGWANAVLLAKKHKWFFEERPDWFYLRGYGSKKFKEEVNS